MSFLHRHGAFKGISEELSDRYTRLETVFIGELLPLSLLSTWLPRCACQ